MTILLIQKAFFWIGASFTAWGLIETGRSVERRPKRRSKTKESNV
jgi:hypothetical protein